MAFYTFMENYFLSDREHQVLEAVVRNYILSAAPTSSRFLSKQGEFDLSPASLRNIMSDLEEQGFITQPHTSAGRVPTDKGYRYYVDRLMKLFELPDEIKKTIKESLAGAEPSDLHLLMEATSKALSRATHQLGVILAPKLASGVFRHLYIFPIDNHRVLLHLTIDTGFVKTMICEVTTEISPDRLARACEVINARFFGMTLQDMCEGEGDIFSDVEPFELGIIRLFVPSIKKIIRDEKIESIYAEGETNIMTQPEFFSRDSVGAIIEILEEKRLLLHMFETETAKKTGVVIIIGGENQEGQLKSFSIIKTNYQVGNMVGSLGVIGPKRMPYPFLVSAVDYTANLLGDLYSK
jgi:heat-inducible transcriptional repressor